VVPPLIRYGVFDIASAARRIASCCEVRAVPHYHVCAVRDDGAGAKLQTNARAEWPRLRRNLHGYSWQVLAQ
jgi:hypothetical protein